MSERPSSSDLVDPEQALAKAELLRTVAETPGPGVVPMAPKRCSWVRGDDPLRVQYHDREWGVPVREDRKHFEFLVLAGAQAGLSWTIVLGKREGYRRAFAGFEPEKVARFSAQRIEKLTSDSAIIRNRIKIQAAVRNARAFLTVQEEFGSFDSYCWRFVDGRPKVNSRRGRGWRRWCGSMVFPLRR